MFSLKSRHDFVEPLPQPRGFLNETLGNLFIFDISSRRTERIQCKRNTLSVILLGIERWARPCRKTLQELGYRGAGGGGVSQALSAKEPAVGSQNYSTECP